MKKIKKDTKGYAIAAIGFLIAFLVLTGVLIYQKTRERKAAEEYEKLVQDTKQEKEEEQKEDILKERGIEIPAKEIDWAALKEKNQDIYAWIYIPNTKVDYPILQHPTELSYYLNHNLDGREGYPGCIYTQNLNQKDFSDPNTVIYGHNMKDGTMFASLHFYEDKSFFEENRYVFIYTEEQVYVYEIFAAYEGSDVHLLYNYDFDTPSNFQMYLDSVLKIRDMSAHIAEDVEVSSQNHIITLSTCIKNKPKNRYLVQAVLVNEPKE